MRPARSSGDIIIHDYNDIKDYHKKINSLQWKGYSITIANSQGDPPTMQTVQLEEMAIFLWVRKKIYAFLSLFSGYYNDKYHKHNSRPLRTYKIKFTQERTVPTPLTTLKTTVVSSNDILSSNNLRLPSNDTPAKSPFKDSFFKVL